MVQEYNVASSHGTRRIVTFAGFMETCLVHEGAMLSVVLCRVFGQIAEHLEVHRVSEVEHHTICGGNDAVVLFADLGENESPSSIGNY